VAPEFRLGLEPIVRITASIGYVIFERFKSLRGRNAMDLRMSLTQRFGQIVLSLNPFPSPRKNHERSQTEIQ
jgi:hypothetical protein